MKRLIILVSVLAIAGCKGSVKQEESGQDVRISPEFRLMGHRGGVVDGGKNPENSIAALDEAILRGYTGAEIDVRQSRDGVLFLYHNRTFERDYDSKGRGEEMTWEEIQALRPLKEGNTPPYRWRHIAGTPKAGCRTL